MRWKHFAENHRRCTPPCAPEDPITNCTGSPEGFSHLWPYITCLLCSWWQSTTLCLWQTPTHPSMTINVTSSMQPPLTFPDTASCLILCFHRTWCRHSDSHVLHCPVMSWFGVSFFTPKLWAQETQLLEVLPISPPHLWSQHRDWHMGGLKSFHAVLNWSSGDSQEIRSHLGNLKRIIWSFADLDTEI